MTEQRCGNCRFWDGQSRIYANGECLKNPPVIYFDDSEDGLQHRGYFPETFESEWCGEWKEKG